MAQMVSNEIIWEIHGNYQKQTFRNRYHICTDQGRHNLSIPIVHSHQSNGRQLHKDVKIDNSVRWQRQHWRTLQTAYRTSAFFEFFEDELAPLFEKPYDYLIEFNWDSIQFLCGAIEQDFPQRKTESFNMSVGPNLDARHLIDAKKTQAIQQPEYFQLFADRHGFVPNCSCLDLLFSLGNEAGSYLKRLEIE